MVVGLGENGDAEAVSLQNPSNDGGSEGGMIHVGVAGYEDEIGGIPAAFLHFAARQRQEGMRGCKIGRIGRMHKRTAFRSLFALL